MSVGIMNENVINIVKWYIIISNSLHELFKYRFTFLYSFSH